MTDEGIVEMAAEVLSRFAGRRHDLRRARGDLERALAQIHARRQVEINPRAKAFSLLLKQVTHFRAADPFRKSGVVFNRVGQRSLSTRLHARQNERF